MGLWPANSADAGEEKHWLAPSGMADWRATVANRPAERDPLWTAHVYARRAAPAETASLADTAQSANQAANQSGNQAGKKPSVTGAGHDMTGLASYYAEDQATASGEPFDKAAMTAAHKTLPFGTKVRVTNLTNGQSAILRINDRGPFVPGRVIDVSEAAADALGMRARGLAEVKVEAMGQ